MTATIRVSQEKLEKFIYEAFLKTGMPEADARTMGALMAEADLQGSDGHGVIRMVPYITRFKGGGVNLTPNIRVVKEKAAMALIDGDNGMGHLVMKQATELAIKKAKTAGVAWVGSVHSNHAGPASLYARMPLAHDMIGLYFAVGNANHLPPWGGLSMLLSTNPIACAIPAMHEAPVILDMATTVTSYGKVKAKRQRGEMMPEGWMINRDGTPLLDPQHADDGLLLPIGGYKGYGLALIVGLLAGTLQGAAMGKDVVDFNKDSVTPTNTGQAILVINLEAFGEVSVFKSAVDTLVQDIRASERLPGVDRVWLPGEQSHARRQAYGEHGIPVANALVTELEALAQDLGVEPLKVA
jgi:LDH2 family malate/lactate/ureidoglycolate dehydrogenase